MEKGASQYRNSRMEYDKVYFWTDTIKDWICILSQDKYKEIIVSSLKELVKRQLIIIYGFVIMPNHLHIIWELKEPNGKEMAHASFNKFTSHRILSDLKNSNHELLKKFKVNEPKRAYRMWQRDPLAILMDKLKKVEQKLNYLHCNPLQERWTLVRNPEDYYWSSASFYENGHDEFGVLTHYASRF